MRLLISLITALIILTGLLDSQQSFTADAQEIGPHFTDIIVTTSDTHLLLFGELQESLTEEMLEALHSGIPITFLFFVRLILNVPNWPDDELVAIEFSHSLSYDTLKDTYTVEIEETSKKKITAASLEEAKKLLNEIHGLKVIELSKLIPERTYRLKVKADLYKKTLPMSLHSIIPFISWWDLKTDWYTIEFTY